jgi:putative N-acetylmannosamine-6-phosphate epimerase
MELIGIVVAWAAAFFGYTRAKQFVKNRLRYVEAAYRSSAPWKAGIAAGLVATPIAWALPIVTGATAILFGGAVGLGVAAGRRELRRRLPAGAMSI